MKMQSLVFGAMVLVSSMAIVIFMLRIRRNDIIESRLFVPTLEVNHDEDRDGVKDLADIVAGARDEVHRQPTYKDAYYTNGFPPDTEGVCTDVIWRAFREAGYDVKKMVDEDIRKHAQAYPRIRNRPDPNIDFRRVDNLLVFFKRHATALTIEVKPDDVENLREWQGGDIVIFDRPHGHIAIVSDHRTPDGVPYLIHNSGPSPREENALMYWNEHISKIIGHFRWPKL